MKTHQLSIISQNNNSTIFQVGQQEYILDSSEEEDQKKGRENYCYFCKQQNMNSCVNRSLYHKYSDVTDKEIRDIDKILKKDKFLLRYNYDEMQYDFDESQHLRENYDKTKTHFQMMELLEYYKYRKYVPIFSKSRSALSATESIYYYYYERLKVYYNKIKKQLNMTLEDSSKSESSSASKYSDSYSSKQNLSNLLSENQLKDTCQPLPQIKSKESLRQFQTQSKALEDVLTLLKKNQQQLKRIKTLKTQDCYNDTEPRSLYKKKKNAKQQKASPFDDHEQRTTFFRTSEKPTISTSSNNSHLKLGNITKINKRLQKSSNQNIFYRYIESIRNERVNDAQRQIKIRKKSVDQGRNSLSKKKFRGYQDQNNQWVRDKEELASSRKGVECDISKNLGFDAYRQDNTPQFGSSSHRLLREKSSSRKKSTKKLSDIYEEPQLSRIGRDHIRSLPKILMEFQNKPRRSMSSFPIKNQKILNNYHSNKVDSKILPLRRQIKQSPYKKSMKDQDDISRSKSTQKLVENQKRGKNTNQIVRRSRSKNDYYEYKKQTSSKEKLVLKQPTHSLTKNTFRHEQTKQVQRTQNDHNLKADLYRKINKQSMNTYQINTCTTNQQHRKSHQNSIQIEKDDNLASVRRKKLEELKIKSNRKKQ